MAISIKTFQRLIRYEKGAVIKRLFYYLFVLLNLGTLSNSAIADIDCTLNVAAEHVKSEKVKQVVDGDTIRLENDVLVRFIGINTPEIDHKFGKSEPFAEQARDALQKMISANGNSVKMVLGVQYRDRHDRLLAHLYTHDGGNIQQALLEQGLASWILVPPNSNHWECYREAEQKARQANKGIWSSEYTNPRDVKTLGKNARGFMFIRGNIERINVNENAIWLNFGTHVALRINKSDLPFFSQEAVLGYENKFLVVRGWLHPEGDQVVMTLRHPAAIEIMD